MNLVPKLRKEKKVINIHQDKLIDEYAWIKQKDWQSVRKDPSKLNKEVLKYIKTLVIVPSSTIQNGGQPHLSGWQKIFGNKLENHRISWIYSKIFKNYDRRISAWITCN